MILLESNGFVWLNFRKEALGGGSEWFIVDYIVVQKGNFKTAHNYLVKVVYRTLSTPTMCCIYDGWNVMA